MHHCCYLFLATGAGCCKHAHSLDLNTGQLNPLSCCCRSVFQRLPLSPSLIFLRYRVVLKMDLRYNEVPEHVWLSKRNRETQGQLQNVKAENPAPLEVILPEIRKRFPLGKIKRMGNKIQISRSEMKELKTLSLLASSYSTCASPDIAVCLSDLLTACSEHSISSNTRWTCEIATDLCDYGEVTWAPGKCSVKGVMASDACAWQEV